MTVPLTLFGGFAAHGLASPLAGLEALFPAVLRAFSVRQHQAALFHVMHIRHRQLMTMPPYCQPEGTQAKPTDYRRARQPK
mmetsp:Transcript_47571/g.64526  ORF Transcript_47571/g.64526 Transcript_47571/m.64526 type:complete len:81 (-) Transcript_47571:15-257(-)